jgi:hypothetical protein
MFNAKDVVGALMQNVLAGSSQSRIEHALSDRGLGQPGGVLAAALGWGDKWFRNRCRQYVGQSG